MHFCLVFAVLFICSSTAIRGCFYIPFNYLLARKWRLNLVEWCQHFFNLLVCKWAVENVLVAALALHLDVSVASETCTMVYVAVAAAVQAFVWEAPDGCLLHVESAHPLKLAFLKVSSAAAAALAAREVAFVAWRIQAGLAGKDESWKLIEQNKTLSVWAKTLNALKHPYAFRFLFGIK